MSVWFVSLNCDEGPDRTNCVFNLITRRDPGNYHCICKGKSAITARYSDFILEICLPVDFSLLCSSGYPPTKEIYSQLLSSAAGGITQGGIVFFMIVLFFFPDM